MRVAVACGLAALSTVLGATVVACADLFHSTSDILTACELDAQAPGCVTHGADAGTPTDFCGWSSSQARTNAEHACAWLSACESPLGRNAYGSCMFEALLAYDCAEINPSHPVRGASHVAWDCLWQTQTCADVEGCVFPTGKESCKQPGGTTCGSVPGDASPTDLDTRIECAASGANGESCALWGQTCLETDAGAYCRGSSVPAKPTCYECDDTVLHECSPDAGDFGIDCADNGAQRCGPFPVADAGWLACVPSSDAAPCAATKTVTCDEGVAKSCPAALPETIDCAELLQSASACNPGPLPSTDFDWTSPCFVSPQGHDAGADYDDAGLCVPSCSGSHIVDCYRNAPFELDCETVGLGACSVVTTDLGTQQHPACSPPPSP
jgi:hypothetical protein